MAQVRGQIISGNPGRTTVGVYPNGTAGGTQPSDGVLPRSNIVQTPGADYRNTYIGGNNNDKLIARDRHATLTTGTERGGGRLSGNHDAILDGPARPSLMPINRTINFQQGSDPSNADDVNRGYNKVSTGQWAGQQDGSVQSVYGGTPGMWIPYGAYGGVIAGPVSGIQSSVEPGTLQDGPQKIVSGPPHGLHSATLSNGQQMWARYNVIPQITGPTTSRPYNSKIAGQSYSQTVLPLGTDPVRALQARTAGGNMQRTVAGVGWRGK